MFKYIVRFILFVFVQVYVLNKIPPVHQFIVPYLYYLFILWLPFSIGKVPLLLVSFVYGIITDYFLHTPGLHAAVCVLVAFFRPLILGIMVSTEVAEQNYVEPSIRSLGFASYSIYVLVLTLIHHFALTFIEWLSFYDFGYFVGKLLATSVLSLILIFITEMMFFRKSKNRAV